MLQHKGSTKKCQFMMEKEEGLSQGTFSVSSITKNQ